MRRLALIALLGLAAGCDSSYAISVSVNTAQGSSWVMAGDGLTIQAVIRRSPEATITAAQWTVRSAPATPTLADPFAGTTTMTCPVPGRYVLDYVVHWHAGDGVDRVSSGAVAVDAYAGGHG